MKKILSFIFPQWVSENWKPKSMGAVDKMNNWLMCIGGTLIWLFVYSMMYFNLFETYLYQYYVRAEWGFHLVSWVAAIGSIISIWKTPDVDSVGGKFYTYLIFVLLLVAILFGAGFNFDLRGIE